MVFKTRGKGALLIISAPLLFVFSGLFLANTIMYPAESLPYQTGTVLCFIIAPILLMSGIVVYAIAPHEKKDKRTAIRVAVPREKPAIAYSATRLRLLLMSRIIGTVFTLFLLVAPFIAEGANGWRLFLAMFVAFPFPIFTLPYLAMALYLAFHKRPRWIDVLPIIGCAVILLFLITR